ncbi:MAG: glycoside hydrolase family 15 protein [Candidatus Aramenus sp.]|jgi:GH15 family glucan-1,4-alpha-glucosidase|nr:glycoside hydrolase family 15 protein [Candidatus Aramenus sp.]
MRFATLGNGRLLVNLDEIGRIVDLYYPYVGMENQTSGNPVREALWGNERLILDEQWKTNVEYMDDVNIVEVNSKVDPLGLSINSYSFVDPSEPIYFSIIKVLNNGNNKARFKLFYYHDFNIYSNPFGDTAFYDPYTFSLVHYKSKRYIAVKLFTTGTAEPDFSTSKDNLIDDMKDGKLGKNSITHGNVQSAMGIEGEVDPGSFTKLYYVIVADRTLEGVRNAISKVTPAQIESKFVSTYMFWKSWLNKGGKGEEDLLKLYNVSLIVIKNHMDINGSFIASSDYSFVNLYGDSYQYCWPRDCAYAAYALDISGYGELAVRHFNFIKDLANDEGFLYHKYNPNKTLASSWHPWLYNGKRIYPIQEDETALEVWAIGNHYERYKDLDELVEIYKKFVKPALHFMIRFTEDGLPKPSFDLWEERFGIHIYTVATVYGGLIKGSVLARDMGDESLSDDAKDVAKVMAEQTKKRMVKNNVLVRRIDEYGNLDTTIDASMYAPYFFGMYSPRDPVVVNTMKAIQQTLTVNGGIIRYENDYYQRRDTQPNPWIITTLWLSEYYSDIGDLNNAKKLIDWVKGRATPSGLLPEQVHPVTLESTSVIPLVWSHAEYIISLNKYLNNKR